MTSPGGRSHDSVSRVFPQETILKCSVISSLGELAHSRPLGDDQVTQRFMEALQTRLASPSPDQLVENPILVPSQLV